MIAAVKFDKYDRFGDIHWRTSSPYSLRYNAPLVSRYNSVLKHAPRQSRSILDIGCGDGRLSYLLGRAMPEAKVVGLDSEYKGIAVARQRVEQRGATNISFRVNADGQFDFADDVFDLIVMTDVIEHLLRPDVMLGEIARMLSNNGTALITTPNRQAGSKWDVRHEREFDSPELSQLLGTVFGEVVVYGSWPMSRIRRGKTILGRAVMETMARFGFNPYDKEESDPTSDYGQLTAVCRRPAANGSPPGP